MYYYFYKSKDLKGKIHFGKTVCENKSKLIEELKNEEYYLIKFIEIKYYDKIQKLNKINYKKLYQFCMELSSLIEAGINILEALDIIINNENSMLLKNIIKSIKKDVSAGNSLSKSISKTNMFPSIFVTMIGIGEISGKLEECILNVANYYKKKCEILNKIKAAISYPIFILVSAILMLSFITYNILPIFLDSLNSLEGSIPFSTKALITVNKFIVEYIKFIILIFVGFIIIINYYIKTKKKYEFDKLKFKLPIIKSIQIKFTEFRILKILGILMNAGVNILRSIEIINKMENNLFVKENLSNILIEIRKGVSLTECINKSKIIDKKVNKLISIGEKSGTLPQTLTRISEMLEKEILNKIQIAMKLLEPITIIILAFIVGYIIFSVIIPMFNVMDILSN